MQSSPLNLETLSISKTGMIYTKKMLVGGWVGGGGGGD